MKTRLIYLLLIFFSLQFTLLAQTDRKITLDFQNEELPAALKKLEQASGYRILFTYDEEIYSEPFYQERNYHSSYQRSITR